MRNLIFFQTSYLFGRPTNCRRIWAVVNGQSPCGRDLCTRPHLHKALTTLNSQDHRNHENIGTNWFQGGKVHGLWFCRNHWDKTILNTWDRLIPPCKRNPHIHCIFDLDPCNGKDSQGQKRTHWILQRQTIGYYNNLIKLKKRFLIMIVTLTILQPCKRFFASCFCLKHDVKIGIQFGINHRIFHVSVEKRVITV
jgi:hypothetical protein